MAQDKKSFIAYSDWKDTFDALPDDKAGQLIKHIFAYVNNDDPQTEDILVNAVFVSIRNTLKRDLKKWENQHQQRIDAGKKSAENRKRNATLVDARESSSTDSVTVSDSVNDNKKEDKTTIYLSGGHLSISLEDFNKLAKEYGTENATEYCHNVLNWNKNSKVKSLYLTALKWLKRDNVNAKQEDKSELQKLKEHQEKIKKENGWT